MNRYTLLKAQYSISDDGYVSVEQSIQCKMCKVSFQALVRMDSIGSDDMLQRDLCPKCGHPTLRVSTFDSFEDAKTEYDGTPIVQEFQCEECEIRLYILTELSVIDDNGYLSNVPCMLCGQYSMKVKNNEA